MNASIGIDRRAAASAWWIFVLVGLLGVVVGVIVLAKPSISLATLAVITGVFLLVDGILEIVISFVDAPVDRGLVAIVGIVSAIAGVILIRHPFGAIVVLALLLGLWLLVNGIVRLIATLAPAGTIWSALLALLEIAAGVVIVASPGIGVRTLALLVGIAWVARGVAVIVLGWALRGLRHSPGADAPGAAAAA
jgi:uncharacterized membrane protein HdeD (DUF308 family)